MSAPAVVKIGGSLMEDDGRLRALMASLAAMRARGIPLILVHGGGKDINRNLAWLGEEPRFQDGLRVTGPAAMGVVEMTLSGAVNKKLVGYLNARGARAVGVSGVDGPTFLCRPLDPGLGQVGAVAEARPELALHLLRGGYLPVFSPVSVDADQVHYNVNADDAAGALAEALRAERLVFISDVEGVLDGQGRVLPRLTPSRVGELVAAGVVKGGMIPKLRSCCQALARGVGQVEIRGLAGAGDWDGADGADSGGTVLHPDP